MPPSFVSDEPAPPDERRWPVPVAAFHALFLGGEALPLAFAPGWSLVDLSRSQGNPAILARVERADKTGFSVLIEPRSAGQCFVATRLFNLSQHGALDGVEGNDVPGPMRALAARLAAREAGLDDHAADAIFSTSSGYTPPRATESRRLRLDVVSEGRAGAGADAAGGDDGEGRLAAWSMARAWPVHVSAFHSSYFGGAALPQPLVPGWTVDALTAARVNRGLEIRLARDDGRYFSVMVEPRGSGNAFLSTRFLALAHQGVGPGLRGEEQATLMRALGDLLAAREATLAQADVDAVFQTATLDAADDDEAFATTRPIDFRINRECNEYCLFCNTPEDADRILESAAAVHEAIDREYARGFRRCYFTGREPTLDANLVEYIRHARAAGYRAIGMHTNATTLAKASLVAKLHEAGLTEVQVSMHTFDPRTFDKLVGAERLLEKTLQGLKNLAATPDIKLYLLFVATTLNQDELPEFIARVGRDYGKRVDFVLVSPMAPMGDGLKHPELLPRLDALRPVLERALAVGAACGVAVRIPDRCGLPLCATPESFLPFNLELQNPPGDNLEPNKTKLPVCSTCRYDSRCSGVWQGYIDAHGPGILRPIPVAPA